MKKILFTLLIFATLFGASVAYAQNLIDGGDFEDKDAFIYGTGTNADKIISIENSSVYKYFSKPEIVGYSNVANSGNYSLEINQPVASLYYPVTFMTTLEKGKTYKFTAYVKLKDNSTATKGSLLVATEGNMDFKNYTSNGVYALEKEGVQYDIGNAWETIAPLTAFSKTNWTKFEKIFYVSDSASSESVTAYIGIKHRTVEKDFNYYIDDVSLEEIDPDLSIADGYSKVYAAKGKEMVYTYKAESVFIPQQNIQWSIEGNTNDVSIEGGNLTVGEEASGKINVVASYLYTPTGETITRKKEVEIVPFTANNITINVNGIALSDFSVENENYIYEYKGDTVPTVTATGNQSIVKNENTVFVNDDTKTYDIILKKLPDYNPNLFYDGGFEEGVVNSSDIDNESKMGAVTIGITKDKDNVHSGRYALKITPQAKYATVNMKANVKSGKLYRVTMWIKDSSTSGTNKFKNCFYKATDDVAVEFYSESQKKFVEGYVTSTDNNSFTLNNGWNRIDRLIHITDDEENVRLQFGFCLTNSTSEFYIDDVSIYELDMSELGDNAYMSAIYRTATGEIASSITDADQMEIILYNPDKNSVGTNLLIAEYEDGRLLNLTKEQFTASTDIVEIINKPLALQEGTDSMSVLAWNTGFSPDIKAAHIK